MAVTGRGRGRAGLEGKVGSSVVSSLRCLQDTESEGNLSLEFREGRAGCSWGAARIAVGPWLRGIWFFHGPGVSGK